mgnify:CR=1 FL=1
MNFVLVLVLTFLVCVKSEFAVTQDIIDDINSSGAKWIAGHNQFSKMTIEEAKMLMGVKTSSGIQDEHDSKKLDNTRLSASLPSSFDWRENSTCKSLHHISKSGQCAAGWAVGAVEAFSDRVCIHSKGAITAQFSAQQLLDCDHLCHMMIECDEGCKGGVPITAWNYLAETGTPVEQCYPYTSGEGEAGRCKQYCADGSEKKLYKAKTAYFVEPTTEEMKYDILNYGPIQADFMVFRDFTAYTSGVYEQHSHDQLGKAAVKILGWGVEKDVEYWLCANSWGTSWGESGFFKIRIGECGINDHPVAGIPFVY